MNLYSQPWKPCSKSFRMSALFHLSLNVVPGYLLRFLLVETEVDIFFDILSVGFLGIRRQDVLHARNRKTTVLLARRT